MTWAFYSAQGQEKRAGSFPATSNLSFGGYKATLLADPTAAQDAATKAYVDVRSQNEGTHDFSVTGTDYTIPNASWGTPGWFSPILVGPNQIWEVIALATIRCITAAHPVGYRIAIRDSTGAAAPAGATIPDSIYLVMQPPVININFGVVSAARIVTDGTVPASTTLRVVMEVNGTGANARLLRDGNQYGASAWRRV